MRRRTSHALLALLLAAAPAARGQTLWVEGEDADRSTMNRHPWYDQVKREHLSGGDWISNFSEDKVGTAEYDLKIPSAATYAFWLRANPVQARLDYALDRGPWTPIDLERDVVEPLNIAADAKPDLRFIGWTHVADLKLGAGPHTLRFRTRSTAQNHGAIDAFTLTTEPFVPSGIKHPGGDSGTPIARFGGAGTWTFNPERDAFRPDALLDLRGLNEKVAGQNGFVRLSDDGNAFVLGDGSPARFWAVNTYVQRDHPDDLAHHARFLAKRGVNMVRLHGHLEPKTPDAALNDVDQAAIDEAHRLVAAMKKEGIYTTLSPYWAANLKHVPKSWGIAGWPEDQSPQGLLFFNERLQQGYKSWLKALLTRPNSHTGIPLAQDPALAIIQLQNEDSMLFWTMQSVKGEQLRLLGQKFGAWLVKKYGSLDAATRAWQGASHENDDLAHGVVGIHIVWFFTQPQAGGLKARLDDQLQFFAETMADFNREIARYLRDDLGCKQLINAGNWKTADSIHLNDVERWSYSFNDVIGVNNYYSPVHLGPDRGWRIDPGDHYLNTSALLDPRALPTNLKQVLGHPIIISESHWVPPLGYQAEAPFLVAAYQSLTGVDAFYWFATGEPEWAKQDRAEWDAASRKKWIVATPMILGQFPAAALLYRKGYLDEGRPVVEEHRPLADLWGRVPPIIAEDASYDPNRDLGDAAARADLPGGVDPLAFLAGPVVVAYGSDASKTRVAPALPKLTDRTKQVVRGETRQVALDFGRGVCAINAPCAQGAAGFLKTRSPIALADLTIRSDDAYAAITAAALDGQPLARSARVLVQVGTVARPTGWADRPASFVGDGGKTTYQGFQILDTGRMPWSVAEAHASITLKNPALKTARVLDPNGLPVRDIPLTARDGAVTLDLPPDALYVVLEAR